MMAIQKRGALNGWQWWAFFALATWVLSLWFQASRAFFAAPGWDTALTFALCVGMLALSMLVLMYDSYVKERSAGKVIHPVKLFEWLYVRQYPGTGEDSHHE